VLPVSSSSKHQVNVARLRLVDIRRASGMDRVGVHAQRGLGREERVPDCSHEERAFNSKLLIAQVLGRGLRRPTAGRAKTQ